jgi:two-component system, NtrC family, C4-dicarboxylate transport sensor histidine kinase DctB
MSVDDGSGPFVSRGGAGTPDAARDPAVSPAAERLAALQEENRRLRELLAAAGRLAEFGRFAAKLNHELRQPLFAIKGLAQLLLDRDQVDVEEVRDFARHIVEQSERLTTLVSDLRHLSVPISRAAPQVTDVSPVLLRVASLLDWRLRKGVTLRTELAADLPLVAVPAHALEQMLVNLLANALDAVGGRPAPTIQIRVQRAPAAPTGSDGPGMVEIFVADNGSGVPLSVRERLFEDFFTTKGAEAGTGLGLAVSREIARAAGGTLELFDPGGTWNDPVTTVFKLMLPIATDELAGFAP